jgi:hypothetical protein
MEPAFQFVPEEHAYLRSGVRIPSVTQILEAVGLVDYSHIPDSVLERKAEIGTAAHAACHYYDENDLDLGTIAPEVSPYVAAWMKFRAETNFTPELVEYRGIATVDGMEYGFTLDRVGQFQGRRHLLDIKCTAAVEISWGPQTAAYEMATGALPRMAVHLKPNGNYSLVPLNDVKDYQVFKWSLGLIHWMRMKGKC